MTLQEMNNNFKKYVNEASGISVKCKRALIRLVAKDFYVDLPTENYLNIDFELLENGNIVMRDVEYKTKYEINNQKELEDRFSVFEQDAKALLEKNALDFDLMKRNKEWGNLLIVALLTIVLIAIVDYAINCILMGNLIGLLWLGIILVVYIVPYSSTSVRKRIKRAINFIKKGFK